MKYIFLFFVLLFSNFGFSQEQTNVSSSFNLCNFTKVFKMIGVLYAEDKKNPEEQSLQEIYNNSSILKDEFSSWISFYNFGEREGFFINGVVKTGLGFGIGRNAPPGVAVVFGAVNNQCYGTLEMSNEEWDTWLNCMSQAINKLRRDNSCPSSS